MLKCKLRKTTGHSSSLKKNETDPISFFLHTHRSRAYSITYTHIQVLVITKACPKYRTKSNLKISSLYQIRK